VLGVKNDRLFPVSGQQQIADCVSGELVGGSIHVIESEFGHDGFLIETKAVGERLRQLLP
jgi:homoserine O-acetyltransferase